jgi:siderophore synthetase component
MNAAIDLLDAAVDTTPESATQHLQPQVWAKVNRLLICKAIVEFAHELLIQPQLLATEGGWGHYSLAVPERNIAYRFRAQLLSLDHWRIEHASIEKLVDDAPAPLDALNFIIEFSKTVGIPEATLPIYLDEISSTLYGSAYKHAKKGLTAEQLTHADFQAVETAMMEGHPSFVANNGRIGFNAVDYRAYAPEAAAPITLVWLAVHKDKATFSSVSTLSYTQLMNEELGTATLASYHRRLQSLGLNPDDYIFMPSHPWQWYNKLSIGFAADIANRMIVCMGHGDYAYLAQQSIRTFFNTSQPAHRYVKMSLSILNMGFMRGLSPYYMLATPAINEWVKKLIEEDRYLAANGFTILREVASVGYRNSYYETAIEKDSPYKKMLSALWRESPVSLLKPHQRLMTMASLLHLDADGNAVLPALIKSSGIDTATWIGCYLNAYLAPLLHCFYAHDMVFMPHGENLILILENNVPLRALMKDIAEEVAILNTDIVLPDNVKRLSVSIPEQLKILSIFTDVFDCIFRYVAHILVEQADYPQENFWRAVASCVSDYQKAHPELKEKFQRYDLFAPEFTRSCLNRLQLGNNQQMIDLADPAKNLKFAGTLKNPLAVFKPQADA